MKLSVIVLLVFTVVDCGPTFSGKPKIIHGNETTIEKHPWQVSIQFLGRHTCGGSIIDKNTIVTAAHCVTELLVNSYRVVAGVTKLKEASTVHKHNVQCFSIHEDFNGFDYDIAVLKLAQDLKFSEKIQPIKLPEKEVKIPEGTSVMASGWGVTNPKDPNSMSDVLREVDLTIISNDTCCKKLSPITNRMICASGGKTGKDTCQMDSGGPLEHNGTLVGIVSWGDGCGTIGMPGVYTNVAHLREWIEEYRGPCNK